MNSSSRSMCVTGKSANGNRNRKSAMFFRFPDRLPGQMYDAATQCRWQFGSTVTVCPFNFAKVNVMFFFNFNHRYIAIMPIQYYIVGQCPT